MDKLLDERAKFDGVTTEEDRRSLYSFAIIRLVDVLARLFFVIM